MNRSNRTTTRRSHTSPADHQTVKEKLRQRKEEVAVEVAKEKERWERGRRKWESWKPLTGDILSFVDRLITPPNPQLIRVIRRHSPDLADAIESCANDLKLIEDLQTGELRVAHPRFCNRYPLCPKCSERKRYDLLTRYVPRARSLIHDRPDLNAYFVTFTVRPRRTFRATFDNLHHNLTTFIDKCGKYRRGDLKHWPLLTPAGLWSIEIKHDESWNVHAHAIVFTEGEIDERALRRTWREMTGDSTRVHVRPFHAHDNLAHLQHDQPTKWSNALHADFRRVFEYAIKLSELSVRDQVDVWEDLRAGPNTRSPTLFSSWGNLRTTKYDPPAQSAPRSKRVRWIKVHRFGGQLRMKVIPPPRKRR